MPQEKIIINDLDIDYAEKIVLKKDLFFDQERRDFIKNLENIKLQAVPGSGKTTCLIAKLLILSKYLPLKNNRGILILSHTNYTIDEIRKHIAIHCPKIFESPNFIGTIQSFIDKFLTIPFYSSEYKKNIISIDDDVYNHAIEKYYYENIIHSNYNFWFKKQFEKQPGDTNENILNFLKSLRFNENGDLIKKDGTKLSLKKSEQDGVYQEILKMRLNVIESGIISYDDAYYFANRYLYEHKKILKILSEKFRFVFIDETQDLSFNQENILEQIFSQNTCYQKIGDDNQTIYQNNDIDEFEKNNNNESIKKITGSHRLNKNISNIVENFAINKITVNGLNPNKNIKPHILLFNDKNKDNVINKFSEIINKFGISDKEYPFFCIGRVSDGKTENDSSGNIKYSIPLYCKNYKNKNKILKSKKIYLVDYINSIDNSYEFGNIINTIKSIFKRILFISDKKINTINDFFDFFKINNKENFFYNFKKILYESSLNIMFSDTYKSYTLIVKYIEEEFLKIFNIEYSPRIEKFINKQESEKIKQEKEKPSNSIKSNGININIGTVYSVKGQTHSATLYLETFYYEHESEKLRDSIACKNTKIKGKRNIKTSKIMYVGFSRPTNLLCFAIHEKRFNQLDKENLKKYWEIESV